MADVPHFEPVPGAVDAHTQFVEKGDEVLGRLTDVTAAIQTIDPLPADLVAPRDAGVTQRIVLLPGSRAPGGPEADAYLTFRLDARSDNPTGTAEGVTFEVSPEVTDEVVDAATGAITQPARLDLVVMPRPGRTGDTGLASLATDRAAATRVMVALGRQLEKADPDGAVRDVVFLVPKGTALSNIFNLDASDNDVAPTTDGTFDSYTYSREELAGFAPVEATVPDPVLDPAEAALRAEAARRRDAGARRTGRPAPTTRPDADAEAATTARAARADDPAVPSAKGSAAGRGFRALTRSKIVKTVVIGSALFAGSAVALDVLGVTDAGSREDQTKLDRDAKRRADKNEDYESPDSGASRAVIPQAAESTVARSATPRPDSTRPGATAPDTTDAPAPIVVVDTTVADTIAPVEVDQDGIALVNKASLPREGWNADNDRDPASLGESLRITNDKVIRVIGPSDTENIDPVPYVVNPGFPDANLAPLDLDAVVAQSLSPARRAEVMKMAADGAYSASDSVPSGKMVEYVPDVTKPTETITVLFEGTDAVRFDYVPAKVAEMLKKLDAAKAELDAATSTLAPAPTAPMSVSSTIPGTSITIPGSAVKARLLEPVKVVK